MLGGAVGFPWLFQLAIGLAYLGGWALGIIGVGAAVVWGGYALVRWILRGRE